MANGNGQEKAERAKQIVNTAIQSLADSLERGESEGLKEHLRAMARFSRYSVGNAMLIFSQCPDATRVEGFRTWQRLGRLVKKGEKGILIRAPFTVRSKDAERLADAEQTIFGFRAAYVFDVNQTNGKPIPSISHASGDPGEAMQALMAYASANSIAVTTVEDLDCYGISTGGAVRLRAGLPAAEAFSTLAHELAHEILHKVEGANPSREIRELEAEAVAFVVCESIGLTSIEAATDYIHFFQGDAATLWRSLESIHKASSEMIAAIETTRIELAA